MGKKEFMKVYGVFIKLKDGSIMRELVNSNVLGNIISRFRGITSSENINHNENTIFHLRDCEKGELETYKNEQGEAFMVPMHKISYIKYEQNKGCVGPEKKEDVFDWEPGLVQWE